MKQIVCVVELGEYSLYADIAYSTHNWTCLDSEYVRDVLQNNGFKVESVAGIFGAQYYNRAYVVSWKLKIVN